MPANVSAFLKQAGQVIPTKADLRDTLKKQIADAEAAEQAYAAEVLQKAGWTVTPSAKL